MADRGWARAFRTRASEQHDLSKLAWRMPVPCSTQLDKGQIATSTPECQASVLVARRQTVATAKRATARKRRIIDTSPGAIGLFGITRIELHLALPIVDHNDCQRELRFLRSAGRRSAHFRMASRVGQRDWPHDVRQYSTLGGT